MMQPQHSVVTDQRGVTVLEFALILPVMLTLIFGGLELGYRAYLGAVIQGALLEVARVASVGNKTEDQIDTLIKGRIGVLTAIGNVKSIQKESFFNFSNVGKPEKITSDTDPIGVYNATDCYEDANNNNRYDTALNSGIGTADDIVRYKVTVTYPDLLPAKGLLGWGNEQTIVASTVLRNEPFTGRSQPTIRCS